MNAALPHVLEEYAEVAGFLHVQRARLLASRGLSLVDLQRFDERLEAHLDGLLLAGEDGVRAALSSLIPSAFVAGFLAVRRGDARRLAGELTRRGRPSSVMRDLVAALAWAPFVEADAVCRELDGPASALRIHALRVHRRDPGDAIPVALTSGDPGARAAALRATGELGRADVLPLVLGALDDPDDTCRRWAACSGALLGAPPAIAALVELSRRGRRLPARVVLLAARLLPIADAEALLGRVAVEEGPRIGIEAAAGRGDPGLVPWILQWIDDPATARLAAWAYGAITGCDPSAEGLAGAPPAGFRAGPSDDPREEDVRVDPDEELRWPDPVAVRAHWAGHEARFALDRRYLLGRPTDEDNLVAVLRTGPLALRASAAMGRCLLAPRSVLFEVRAPALRQTRALAALSPASRASSARPGA